MSKLSKEELEAFGFVKKGKRWQSGIFWDGHSLEC
jgi:hypothetical protein